MPRPWEIVATCPSPEGVMELRRRHAGNAFLIAIGGRVIMNSESNRSERALGTLAAESLKSRVRPRVMIGGLGMGFTLRAVLDGLGPDAEVIVIELLQPVIDWCRGPLAKLHGDALKDRRVTIVKGDVARSLFSAKGLDAILLDLWEGPHGDRNDPLWGDGPLAAMRAALKPDGVLAVWSEDPARDFVTRLEREGFAVREERIEGGGPRHRIYLARPKAKEVRTERSRR